MHKFLLAAFALALALPVVATSAHADEDLRATIRDEIEKYQSENATVTQEDPKELKVYWDNGLKFKGKNFKGSIMGRIMFDISGIDDNDYIKASGRADSANGFEFRRVRFAMNGQVGKHLGYKIDFDLGQGVVGMRDVYIDVNHLKDCFGCRMPNIRIGHFKEPYSLEWQTSSNYMTFIERSTAVEALSLERAAGIMVHDVMRGKTMGYGLGLFSNATGRFTSDRTKPGDARLDVDGYGVSGRFWWTPFADCNCACERLHVGVSASYRGGMAGSSRALFRSRPGIHHLTHQTIQTDPLEIEELFLYAAELAWVHGPWSLQAEYLAAEMNAQAGAQDASFWGYYVQASYWLTGECRNYSKGAFKRVKPCCNWLDQDCCCKGAWELAARYSFVDLDDRSIRGGSQGVVELGVNWHLRANARVMVNFVWANVDNLSTVGASFNEDIYAVVTRFQIDF